LLSPDLALAFACRAACLALGIGFLEQLTVFQRAFGSQGPFSVAVAARLGGRGSQSALLDKTLYALLVIGAVSSMVGFLVGPYSVVGQFCLVTILTCMALIKLRRVMASDGAEQMAILTLFAACVVVLPGRNEEMTNLAVWFIGAQSLLSYATAGVAKALSRTWRQGNALPLIMGSGSHGQPWAAKLLATHPRMAKLLTRSVIVFECCFPFIILAPLPVVIAFLIVGFMLHLGCAISMGLNAFLLAFPGSYLCVAYLAQRLSPFR
jgi:hypothetical protein